MELDSGGNWKTLQLLRNKHQFFVTSLERYKPAAQIKSSQGKVLPIELKMLVRLSGKDWDDAVEVLKEASERQAVMHLFACFERIIRVDGQLRGEQLSKKHHAFFCESRLSRPFLCAIRSMASVLDQCSCCCKTTAYTQILTATQAAIQ